MIPRTKNTIEGYHVIVRPVSGRTPELRLGPVGDGRSHRHGGGHQVLHHPGRRVRARDRKRYASIKTRLPTLQEPGHGRAADHPGRPAPPAGRTSPPPAAAAIYWSKTAASAPTSRSTRPRKWPPAPPSASSTTARSSSTPATRPATPRVMTLANLAERMQALGCQTALNLDGGGSTAVGRAPTRATPPARRPTSPPTASCASARTSFSLSARSRTQATAARLYLYPNSGYALPGAKLSLHGQGG